MNRNRAREEEFERVAMMHVESLLRAALRLTETRATAEDLVQETLLRAWRAFEQYAPGTNCKAWLFRILFNCANERRRRKSVRPKLVSFDDCVKGDANSMQTDPPAHSQPEVIRAFDGLTEEHRVVLILVVVEGFTCKETARMLDVPIGTVMSRLSRARVSLRQQLTKEN